MTRTPIACPRCGEPIEATAKVYFTLTVTGWEYANLGEDWSIYCGNDHPAPGVDPPILAEPRVITHSPGPL